MSEPNQGIVQLIKDIVMYTKFKILQVKNDYLELNSIKMLLLHSKCYIIKNLERSEMQKSIVLAAMKIRFE